MTREIITLTPAHAEELLKTNYEKQRRLSVGYAATIARDIVNGKWNGKLANNAIIISDTGKLLDGQHRCKAVIIADKPIEIEVVRGMPEEWFNMIDGGKPRSAVDFVNTKYRNKVTALARFAVCVKAGMPIATAVNGRTKNFNKHSVQATRSEVLEEVRNNEELLVKLCEYANSIRSAFYGGNATAYADALYLIAYECDFNNLGVIKLFVDELTKDYSEFAIVNDGKKRIARKIMSAKVSRTTVHNEELITIILAIFDKLNDGGALPTRTEYIKNRYNAMIKSKCQEAIQ